MYDLVLLFSGFGVALLLLRFPLADLALVGLLLVDVGEDKVEDFGVPSHGMTLNTLLDVLEAVVSKRKFMKIIKGE